MTDLEKLYKAVSEGFKEIGVDARFDRHTTETLKPAPMLILVKGRDRFQIYLSSAHQYCTIRKTTSARPHRGPDLADPLFFERVRDMLDSLN